MNINSFDFNLGAFQNHSEKSEGGKARNIAFVYIWKAQVIWCFFFHRDLLILPNIHVKID